MLSFVLALTATLVAAETVNPVLPVDAIPSSQSLCGLDDNAVLLDLMQGYWIERGAISFESEAWSTTQPVESVVVIVSTMIRSDAVLGTYQFDQGDLTRGQVYNVDQVDDLLETAEVEWIADAVSLTPCGPEDLPQVSAELYEMTFEEGLFADRDAIGRVTVLPYFSDKMVILVEAELRGEWGIAYLTTATLMTRE